MRALIGAIITTGALIGLGLTNLGLGLRYQYLTKEGQPIYDMKFKDVDNPLQFGVVFLVLMALIGLAIAFVGLAYHHERRYRERLRELGESKARP
jgi:cell division protein FtsX